ncbi:MAG: GNAT family N-acetyltransferase [Bdellovibrionales bacterium]|nr:GNAT family N-acetyltransferase [Bdellovibrionales bacterium]
MENSIEDLMLTASELFHYAHKFKEALFLIAIDREASLHDIMLDLKVLLASRVPCALLYASQADVQPVVERWNTHGFTFEHVAFEDRGDVSRAQLSDIINRGSIPLLECRCQQEAFDKKCVEMASELGANKLVMFIADQGLKFDDVYYSYPTVKDVQNFLTQGARCNVEPELLARLIQAQVVYGFDTVFLEAKSGSLFQEIFTYRGSGTLITDSYPNVLRAAEPTDVADILFLLKPAMARLSVVPLNEEQLIDSIQQFYVFTVDGKIVACARLKDYDDFSELGKICTLPRYQGKGRAKQLTIKLLDEAKKGGKSAVFALSIEPYMWGFFTELGFLECDKSELPASWREQYDSTRPSKAFCYWFSKSE